MAEFGAFVQAAGKFLGALLHTEMTTLCVGVLVSHRAANLLAVVLLTLFERVANSLTF